MGKREREEKGSKTEEKKRIGRLDEQTLGYYRRVSDTLQEGFENAEDKDVMLTNIFNQLATEALKVSRNQTVSYIVQSLVQEATAPQLVQVMNAFSTDWETACTDRFASHVTQTMLTRAAQHVHDDINMAEINFEGISENPKPLKELIINVHSYILNNIAVHMQHTYTSHIVRVLLEILSGTSVGDSVIRSRLSRQQNKAKQEEKVVNAQTPEEFKPLLKSMLKKILDMQKLKDHAENALSNPVLQTVLLVSKSRSVKACRRACQQLIDNTNMFNISRKPAAPTEENSILTTLPDLLTHEVGSHLVEQVVVVAPEDLFQTLLQENFKPHLLTMSLHPIANYILQRLINSVHTQEQFEMMYSSLCKNFEDILAHKRPHVIINLAQGCLKFGAKQDKFIKLLMKTFHCYKPEERQSKLFPLVAALTTYDVFYKIPDDEEDEDEKAEDDEEPAVVIPVLTRINLHGAVLLQTLLRFGNPKPVTSSLLDMKGTGLRNLACDAHGSYVYDALVNSKSVGEKTRESLVNKMKGQWVELACSKSGSRVLDKLWVVASIKQKQLIAEELSKHEHRLRGDHFGRFAWRNCALGHFGLRKQAWLNIQKGEHQKRKLFDDIIGGGKKQKIEKEGKSKDEEEDVEDSEAQNEIDEIFSAPKAKKAQDAALKGEHTQQTPIYKRKNTFKPRTFQPSATKGKGKHKVKKDTT